MWNKLGIDQKLTQSGPDKMMKEMLRIVTQSPQSVLEDVLGVSAIFAIVVVGLHLPLTL